MKYFDWDETKNQQLKQERGIGFEEIVVALANEQLIDTIDHPNQKKYSHQQIFIVSYLDYIYLVPFVEDEKKVFLKTIFPSRKYTAYYIGGRKA